MQPNPGPPARDQFLVSISAAILKRDWHWLNWHADQAVQGTPTPFFRSIADTVLSAARMVPDLPERAVRLLAQGSGRDRDQRDYEQMLQVLAELLVVGKVANWAWPPGTTIRLEPTLPGSAMSPDIGIEGPSLKVGIEVKAPSLLSHQAARAARQTQIMHRGTQMPTDGATLPRDNPVKDFLVSADAKFAAFKAADPAFVSILLIVWDDHINEPIAALLAPHSGLLTPESFHRLDDKAVPYPNVDAVVLIRHLHQFVEGAAERPLFDGLAAPLDYGDQGFPYKVVVPASAHALIPQEVIDCLQLVPLDGILGAEYNVLDVVYWLDV
jgi:hypothetical protein